jgi:hypothetical protein
MLEDGSWGHPGDEEMLRLVPFIRDPLEFRTSVDQIMSHRDCLLSPDESHNELFHEYRGSQCQEHDLPWRDIENSCLIAINKVPGDDVAIGLDYRTSRDDPRVIASEWVDGPTGGFFWREVAPTFTDFLKQLRNK